MWTRLSLTGEILLLAICTTSNELHPESVERKECPRNWTRYDRTKSCFLVIEQRLRWSEAERVCAKYGGHLASVVDEYENIFAFGLFSVLAPTLLY
uniref:C-type lectin domain-containing protein n=1 Tax=Parascaris equorum TaxID=6256 RepID=A0A914S4Z0_PAREQ